MRGENSERRSRKSSLSEKVVKGCYKRSPGEEVVRRSPPRSHEREILKSAKKCCEKRLRGHGLHLYSGSWIKADRSGQARLPIVMSKRILVE